MLSKHVSPSLSLSIKLRDKLGIVEAEDGHHKMGAHEAGRVACHASSLAEWAVKIGDLHFSLDEKEDIARCLLLF